MKAIYEPKGRALEYSLLACNLFGGCVHGCDYCYAPNVLHLSREEFHSDQQAKPRAGILKALEKDAAKLQGTDKRVLLCFTCDPYQYPEIENGVTREALKILRRYDVPFQILTKGGIFAQRDFDLYGPNDAFATTLTFRYIKDSYDHEPEAAKPGDRIDTIEQAHYQGITTWVSLEPVLDPGQSLELLDLTHPFVDLFKIGKLNHRANMTDWRAFAVEAIRLCERYGVAYYVKDDLAKFVKGVKFTNTDTRRIIRKDVDKPA